jgi:hypothetical protein
MFIFTRPCYTDLLRRCSSGLLACSPCCNFVRGVASWRCRFSAGRLARTAPCCLICRCCRRKSWWGTSLSWIPYSWDFDSCSILSLLLRLESRRNRGRKRKLVKSSCCDAGWNWVPEWRILFLNTCLLFVCDFAIFSVISAQQFAKGFKLWKRGFT